MSERQYKQFIRKQVQISVRYLYLLNLAFTIFYIVYSNRVKYVGNIHSMNSLDERSKHFPVNISNGQFRGSKSLGLNAKQFENCLRKFPEFFGSSVQSRRTPSLISRSKSFPVNALEIGTTDCDGLKKKKYNLTIDVPPPPRSGQLFSNMAMIVFHNYSFSFFVGFFGSRIM